MTTERRSRRMGRDGQCICPKCEARVPHRQGVRCQDESCPKCGAKMLRVGSEHYELWLERKARKD